MTLSKNLEKLKFPLPSPTHISTTPRQVTGEARTRVLVPDRLEVLLASTSG